MERKEHYSRKRAAILEALRDTSCHPTAGWIYERLKPECPDLSLGTVYRNLKRLCESGQAVSVGVLEGFERFDGDVSPHGHLMCRQCGAVVDVFGLTVDGLEEAGCQVDSVSVTLQGLCPDCMKQQKSV